MPILAIKTAIDVAKTYGSPITITGITKASPGVVTAAAHGQANGAVGVLAIEGMSELNGQVVRVAAQATNTFELEGIDTTAFGTFTSGTFTPITAWDRLGTAQSLSAPQTQPPKIDVTTLVDDTKQYVYGLEEPPEITVQGLLDPFGVAVANLRAASRARAARVIRCSFPGTTKLYFNSNVAGGDGFEAQSGAAMTQSYRFTQIKTLQWFAS